MLVQYVDKGVHVVAVINARLDEQLSLCSQATQDLCAAGTYVAMSSYSASGNDTSGHAGFASRTVQLQATPTRGPPADNDSAKPDFSTVRTVEPFSLKAVQKSVAAGEAPMYRLSDIEHASAEGAKEGAVTVRMSTHGGNAVHARQCVLLQLAYTRARARKGGGAAVSTADLEHDLRSCG